LVIHISLCFKGTVVTMPHTINAQTGSSASIIDFGYEVGPEKE
jgi:hypothetical protein